MAGTIEKRGNSIRLKFMYKKESYTKTINNMSDRAAKKELEKFISDVKNGYIKKLTNDYTFFEFATIWLKDVIVPNCNPITVAKDLSTLNDRIFPHLGKYKIREINVMILNRYISTMKNEKTICKDKRSSKPLSKGTIEKYWSIISSCMSYAVECEIIEYNPCKKIKLAKKLNDLESEVGKKDLFEVWSLEEYKRALFLMKNETIEKRAIFELAVKTGLRRSEIFGLTYDDIDLTNKTLSVNKTRHYLKEKGMITRVCKNKNSIRTISIPTSLITTLKIYKNKYPNNEYIFDNVSMNGICTSFKRFQEKNNLTIIRFHDMRHTHATILLQKGVDLKTISSRLGHASIKRTMDTYIKFIKELDKNASDIIDEI